MVRDLFIELYLFLFKIQFNLFKILPLQNKVTFVVSFGENSFFLFKELEKQNRTEKIVFLLKNKDVFKDKQINNAHKINFETLNLFAMVKSIYHLATSKHIIIDNYYGFLAATNFKDGVQVIQLWHATGAVKSFGLTDQTISKRSKIAKRRFSLVYQKFHKIVVGSDEMARIFVDAFNVSPDVILRTGVPRTDLFFNKDKQHKIKAKLFAENKQLKRKKVILYAPTYRDNDLTNFDLRLDIEKLANRLAKDYVLVLKLHPVVKSNVKKLEKTYAGFVFDYSTYHNVNDLLLITDILITDYSSIHYEFALLNRPMIFYAYDQDSYNKKRGIIGDYREQIAGPVAKTTDEIINYLESYPFDYGKIKAFSKKWNRYSQGNSSRQLVNYMFKSSQEAERYIL